MSVGQTSSRLELPASLQTQMHDYRRRVWTIKSIEAICGALFGVLVSYLAVFALDRVINTPSWARLAILTVAIIGCATVPVYFHRWIWSHRKLDQLARLLSRSFPSMGDQLLGIIELVRNEAEQTRSRALCKAAIDQVSHEAGKRNFAEAVPKARHKLWIWLAGVPAAVAVLLLVLFPAAATNAWARFVAPWQATPRYTFTVVDTLPDRVVVPHGEAVTLPIRLLPDSRWQPPQGTIQVGSQPALTADLQKGLYSFKVPAQIDGGPLSLHIGDALQSTRIEPMYRPELSSVMAEIKLPAYLERSKPLSKDVRGGTLSTVIGSQATFTVTANRPLSKASLDKIALNPKGDRVTSYAIAAHDSRKLKLEWQDEHGLQGLEPFTISLNAVADEAPSVSVEDLPRNRVVLDSETLTFKVRAQDEFGVKQVGIEWAGADAAAVEKTAKGEQILSAGGSEKETLDLTGTFCAQTLKIEPQPLNVRIYVEDYEPKRGRVYSANYLLYVMSAEQHSIWLTEQLSKWHRQSLEVRDREMALHATNQQLRLLTPEELDQADTRRQIEGQSAAERANGKRLSSLVGSGEELVRQAMRNPEFGVGHLEKWAEMLKILQDISGNRMPNVADLLKQSSQAPGQAMAKAGKADGKSGQPGTGKSGTAKSGKAGTGKSEPGKASLAKAGEGDGKGESGKADTGKSEQAKGEPGDSSASKSDSAKAGPKAGETRTAASGSGKPDETNPRKTPPPIVPQIADGESSYFKGKKTEDKPEEAQKKNPSNPRLTLPVTTTPGAAPKSKGAPPPAAKKFEEAVVAQQD
ncbi:MAG: hypothetical protein SGJ20_13645, partial [Planctomycetota bacterium]|nr:hypothetical protein [Planctomycetota bacterium]